MTKKFLVCLIALTLLIGLAASAYAEEKDQIYWAVVDTDGDAAADKLVISSAKYTPPPFLKRL